MLVRLHFELLIDNIDVDKNLLILTLNVDLKTKILGTVICGLFVYSL